MELLINGERLDLSGDKLALKFTSKVMGIDKMEASRSQTFALPMTPRNMRIFGFPHRADMLSAPVRDTFSAQLTYDGGVIYGTFKVTGVTQEQVSGTLIYGELSPLITDWYKKKLNELFISSEHFMLRYGAYFFENSRNFNNALYYNGNGQDKGFRLPTVKVSYLLTQCLAALGANMSGDLSAAASGLRIVCNTLNGYGSDIDAGTIAYTFTLGVGGTYDTSAIVNFSSYFASDLMILTLEDGGALPPQICFRCTQACKVTITGTNPQGVGSITSLADKLKAAKQHVGWYRLPSSVLGRVRTGSYVETNALASDFRAACEFSTEFEPGDVLVYGRYNFNGGLRAFTDPTVSASYMFKMQGAGGNLALFNDGTSWTMGDYYLQPNMPDLTFAELLKLVARRAGKVLTYDDTTNTFGVFDYDFDGAGGAVVAIEPRLKTQGDVKRQVFDYGQTHAVRFDFAGDESPAYTRDYGRRVAEYVTPNKTLDVRTEEVLPLATYNSIKKPLGTFYDINIPCVELDEASGVWVPKAIDKPVLVKEYIYYPDGGTSRNLDTAEMVVNPYLQEICRLSTAVEVEVAMKMFEFVAIENRTRFTYRGAWWFCSAGTWAEGVAKLTLQRYK